MPIPPGTVPEPPAAQSDAAYGAQQYMANRKAGGDIPPNSPLTQPDDTRGYWHSFANAMGLPTNMQEIPASIGSITSMIPGVGQLMSSYNAAKTIYNDPSYEGVNRAFNPLVAPMEQAGGGNIPGALGSATPFVGSMLAAPFLPAKSGPPNVEPGFAPGINLANPRPSSPSIPMRPILGDVSTPPSFGARALEYGVREPISKIPGVGTKLSDMVKGSIAKPGKGTGVTGVEPRPRMATSLSATYPEAPKTDFPFERPFSRLTSPEPSIGSAPLNNPQDIMTKAGLPNLWQNETPPLATAAFGDAPVQPVNPIAGPHPSGVNGLNLPNVAQARTIPGTYFQPGEFAQLMEQLRQHGANRSEIHAAQQQGITNIVRDAVYKDDTPNLTLKEVAASRKAALKKKITNDPETARTKALQNMEQPSDPHLHEAVTRVRSDIVGTLPDVPDQTSSMFNKKSDLTSLQAGKALRDAWQPFREALKESGQRTIKLYRAVSSNDANMPEKTILRMAESPEWIRLRGFDQEGKSPIQEFEIPIDDIIAAPEMDTIEGHKASGWEPGFPKYREYLVYNRLSPLLHALSKKN